MKCLYYLSKKCFDTLKIVMFFFIMVATFYIPTFLDFKMSENPLKAHIFIKGFLKHDLCFLSLIT